MMPSLDYLDLPDYVVIASAILQVEPNRVLRVMNIPLAESALAAPQASFGGEEFYRDVATKAAILCSRLVRNHPLPDGNKRAGYVAMREFLARNGATWERPSDDETAQAIEGLAAGTLSEPAFVDWVKGHVADDD